MRPCANCEKRGEVARLRESLEEMVETFSSPDSGEISRRLAIKDARAVLASVLKEGESK